MFAWRNNIFHDRGELVQVLQFLSTRCKQENVGAVEYVGIGPLAEMYSATDNSQYNQIVSKYK